MNLLEKIHLLGASAKWDTCASTASPRKAVGTDRIGNVASSGICHSFGTDGRCISLFKTLYSNACSYDCSYCTNSASCTQKKTASYTPEELCKVFMHLYMRNYVEGIFLSSGVIKDPDTTAEQLINTLTLLRTRYKFAGYVHLKIIPGTHYSLIRQASELADRLSINLEAPNKQRLSEISSVKDFKVDIMRRQSWMSRMDIPAGHTTQLVVGGSGETDKEILSVIDWEYNNLNLKRGYYSAFQPIINTPLQNRIGTPIKREHRLYNVDFMLRRYGIRLKEFYTIMDDGMLPDQDPKLALAKEYFDGPVDINQSSFDELVRIPGIGPRSAQRIFSIQKNRSKIVSLQELKNIGVVLKRALPFISISGKSQTTLEAFA